MDHREPGHPGAPDPHAAAELADLRGRGPGYHDNAYMWCALIAGTLIGCTDWVDGMLARKYGPTVLGGLLDPIADKVFIAFAYTPFADDRGLDPVVGVRADVHARVLHHRAALGVRAAQPDAQDELHREGQDVDADAGHRRDAAVPARRGQEDPARPVLGRRGRADDRDDRCSGSSRRSSGAARS